jgi:hypothetical protein
MPSLTSRIVYRCEDCQSERERSKIKSTNIGRKSEKNPAHVLVELGIVREDGLSELLTAVEADVQLQRVLRPVRILRRVSPQREREREREVQIVTLTVSVSEYSTIR